MSVNQIIGYSVINGVPSIDPSKVKTIAAYNVRDAFDPKNDADDAALLASIAANGFLTDEQITIRVVGRDAYVISGHRRLAATLAFNAAQRAAKLPGIKGIAFRLEGKSASGAVRDNAEMALDLLLSNSGKPLSVPEKGAAYLRLRSYGWKDTEIAARAAVSAKWIAECVKATRLDARLRDLVKQGVVAPTLAIETAAKHGARAADIVVKAAAKGTGANAGKATGKTIEAVTGIAAKGAKVDRLQQNAAAHAEHAAKAGLTVTTPKVVAPRGTQSATVAGPFRIGRDLDDCVLFDANDAIMCEFPDAALAQAMLRLINQGWQTFKGKAPDPAPVAPVVPSKAPAKAAPVKVTVDKASPHTVIAGAKSGATSGRAARK